jgi:hypothetical protein
MRSVLLTLAILAAVSVMGLAPGKASAWQPNGYHFGNDYYAPSSYYVPNHNDLYRRNYYAVPSANSYYTVQHYGTNPSMSSQYGNYPSAPAYYRGHIVNPAGSVYINP